VLTACSTNPAVGTRNHRLQHHPAVALNEQGYYVGRIERNLYRVTD
jgi:hypothetical protein